jgi:hypothetical protein
MTMRTQPKKLAVPVALPKLVKKPILEKGQNLWLKFPSSQRSALFEIPQNKPGKTLSTAW